MTRRRPTYNRQGTWFHAILLLFQHFPRSGRRLAWLLAFRCRSHDSRVLRACLRFSESAELSRAVCSDYETPESGQPKAPAVCDKSTEAQTRKNEHRSQSDFSQSADRNVHTDCRGEQATRGRTKQALARPQGWPCQAMACADCSLWSRPRRECFRSETPGGGKWSVRPSARGAESETGRQGASDGKPTLARSAPQLPANSLQRSKMCRSSERKAVLALQNSLKR